MQLLGIDIGTTNTKAGIFAANGQTLASASRPTATHQDREGNNYYDPEEMWATVAAVIREAVDKAGAPTIAAIGITSMAESGLLVDRTDGTPKSPFMPWFDTCSAPQAKRIEERTNPFERFQASGLHCSFKLGAAKMLWIRDRTPDAFRNAVWLSASGYIAYRLSGAMAFDYSLAARTYAFRIDRKVWDTEFIRELGFEPEVFPPAYRGGEKVGETRIGLGIGLPAGIPVAIAGHDHVAASLAVGAIRPGIVYDSMGTAETLVGTLEERTLTKRDFESGISFGCHIVKDCYFWMGGNSMSGGSVEWIRGLLGDEALSYETLADLVGRLPQGPTGILYFPYLSGSGAPLPNSSVRGAFVGLAKEHGKGDLLKAVLEGTAYQLEAIRRMAESITGSTIDRLRVVGGGTRSAHWLQIKSNITSCALDLPPVPEATMLGAALAAGIGAGHYAGAEEAYAAMQLAESRQVSPDGGVMPQYRSLYEQGFDKLQAPLRAFTARER